MRQPIYRIVVQKDRRDDFVRDFHAEGGFWELALASDHQTVPSANGERCPIYEYETWGNNTAPPPFSLFVHWRERRWLRKLGHKYDLTITESRPRVVRLSR